jgi:hypothetical protein
LRCHSGVETLTPTPPRQRRGESALVHVFETSKPNFGEMTVQTENMEVFAIYHLLRSYL